VSTIHMWDILQKQNRLNSPVTRPDFKEVVGVLESMLETIDSDSTRLRPGHYTEIRFEDLEIKPVEVLKKMYQVLDLAFTDEFESRVHAFLRQTAGFRKNEFSLTQEHSAYIRERLSQHMNRHKYQ